MAEDKKWEEIFRENLDIETEIFREFTTLDFNASINILCKSPIEKIMLAELMFCRFGYHTPPNKIQGAGSQVKIQCGVLILPQHPIDKYTADFAIIVKDFSDRALQIVVECGGHDFHEKTREQAKHDKKRDRDMLRLGWAVFRFTGSEIYRDVRACVSELNLHATEWIERDLTARGLIQAPKKDDG